MPLALSILQFAFDLANKAGGKVGYGVRSQKLEYHNVSDLHKVNAALAHRDIRAAASDSLGSMHL